MKNIKIAYISDKGLASVNADLRISRVAISDLVAFLESVDAIVLRIPPEDLTVSQPIRQLVYSAISIKPFFTALPYEKLTVFLNSSIKVDGFDVCLSTHEIPNSQFIETIILPDLEEYTVLKYVLESLREDMVEVKIDTEIYLPENYWENRARLLGNIGNSVGLHTAPRAINKARSVHQKEILANALFDISLHFQQNLPYLIDYGCGIGRLFETCSRYTNYFGIDVSYEMIKLAQKNYPSGNFFQLNSVNEEDLPPIDIFLFSTVLHHNPSEMRKAIFENIQKYASDNFYILMLEDFAVTDISMSDNMFPLNFNDIIEEIKSVSNKFVDVCDFKLIGYKPRDYIKRTMLFGVTVK